jgi:hypothetical protein
VCVCVCVRARAHYAHSTVCVCVCVCVRTRARLPSRECTISPVAVSHTLHVRSYDPVMKRLPDLFNPARENMRAQSIRAHARARVMASEGAVRNIDTLLRPHAAKKEERRDGATIKEYAKKKQRVKQANE